jgi:hypothetical protein
MLLPNPEILFSYHHWGFEVRSKKIYLKDLIESVFDQHTLELFVYRIFTDDPNIFEFSTLAKFKKPGRTQLIVQLLKEIDPLIQIVSIFCLIDIKEMNALKKDASTAERNSLLEYYKKDKRKKKTNYCCCF